MYNVDGTRVFTLSEIAMRLARTPANEVERQLGTHFLVSMRGPRSRLEAVPFGTRTTLTPLAPLERKRIRPVTPDVAFLVEVLPRPPLGPPSLIVGRDGAADVVFDHGSISREHARLLWLGDQLGLVDLASSNGTRIDGEPAPLEGHGPPAPVPIGAQLRFGSVECVLCDPERLANLAAAVVQRTHEDEPLRGASVSRLS